MWRKLQKLYKKKQLEKLQNESMSVSVRNKMSDTNSTPAFSYKHLTQFFHPTVSFTATITITNHLHPSYINFKTISYIIHSFIQSHVIFLIFMTWSHPDVQSMREINSNSCFPKFITLPTEKSTFFFF